MWHPVARQGSFLQEVICHSVWVFEEGWIPSCQLTAFRMGDEANQISCGRLQADSVQGSGNDLSSRASRAWRARCAAGLCALLASCSPRLRAGAKAPCRWLGARGRAAAAWRQLWGSPGFPEPRGDAARHRCHPSSCGHPAPAACPGVVQGSLPMEHTSSTPKS